METITINGQEISFTPAPEFTYVSSLIFNGKAVKLSSPNKYRNGFEAYLQGGGQFSDDEKALVDQMVATLNARWQSEQIERKAARAEAARKALAAQEERMSEFGDDVQIYD